jgi:hypothetical protein
LLANYLDHREAFDEVLSGRSNHRILLIEGKSGSGKTTLLKYCLGSRPADSLLVKIQLRGSVVTVAEIFSRTGRASEWDKLPSFTRIVAQFQGASQVRVDGNWLAGINNHINVALHTQDLSLSEQRRTALTDALFDDLSRLGQVVVFVFDTYEQATDEMKAWISGPFLCRVAETPPVRVVIAGQRVPDANNIEWEGCSRTQGLRGVPDPEHWLPVVDSMKWRIDAADPKSFLKALCLAFKGDPDSIMKFLSALPRDEV